MTSRVSGGRPICYVTEMGYLGIFLTSARSFICFLGSAKRSFNRAVNSIIGKIGGSTARNQRVVIELIKTKCMPTLLYGTKARNLRKAQISSLDFVVTRFGMKVLQTSDRNRVIQRFIFLGLSLPSELLLGVLVNLL